MLSRLLRPEPERAAITPKQGYQLLKARHGPRWYIGEESIGSYLAVGTRVAYSAQSLAYGQLPLREEDRLSASEIVAGIGALHLVRDELDRLEADLLDSARTLGIPWEHIAPALDVADRRAAQKRATRLWTRFPRRRRN